MTPVVSWERSGGFIHVLYRYVPSVVIIYMMCAAVRFVTYAIIIHVFCAVCDL